MCCQGIRLGCLQTQSSSQFSLFDALDLDDDMRLLLGKEPFMVLKQMRYAADPSDPAAGKFGAGAHTDWGSFTILATDETPGLQIQMDQDVWLPVPPKKGCLIINSGDQIAHLTNGYYRSAMHRVVIAAENDRSSASRSSSPDHYVEYPCCEQRTVQYSCLYILWN
jgi:isopenicillin N synthase-like dioxygenase